MVCRTIDYMSDTKFHCGTVHDYPEINNVIYIGLFEDVGFDGAYGRDFSIHFLCNQRGSHPLDQEICHLGFCHGKPDIFVRSS